MQVLNAEMIVARLKASGITHVVGLSDTSLAKIFALCQADPEMTVVPVCREGEAFAVAAGLYVGGRHPVVMIQNTGLLESGDAVRGTLVNMRLPILSLISYRGYAGLARARERKRDAGAPGGDSWTDSAAVFLEPTLQAWGLPFLTVTGNEELGRIAAALDLAQRRSAPAAVLLVGGCG